MLNLRRFIVLIPTLFVLLHGRVIAQPAIDEAYVTRLITTLASDDMQGRATFSQGIEKAASFIEGEFQDIGLSHLPGSSSYRQDFHVYSLSPEEAIISLDGVAVVQEDFFAIGNHERISWSTQDGIPIQRIGPDDDFRSEVMARRRSQKDAIILVDTTHVSSFNRFRSYFGRRQRSVSVNEGSTTIFVLAAVSELTSYRVELSNSVEKLDLANIVGMIPGERPDEIVLFSAHYDHIGIRPPVEADSIANGANDDASGTAAVIALARYFKDEGKPTRTLIFAAFTGEESGGYGSQHFSKALNPDKIVAMFNIEMIGKPAVEGPNTAWITGFERSDFGEILQRAVRGTPYIFYPDPYPEQNLFYRSDNATLARLGVPAHSISTTPIDVDKNYHRVSDEVSTLDLVHMTNTIGAIAAGAATIISGAETPTRINLADRE